MSVSNLISMHSQIGLPNFSLDQSDGLTKRLTNTAIKATPLAWLSLVYQ